MVHRSSLVDREMAGRGAVEAHVDGERTLIHGITKCRSDRGSVEAAFVDRGAWRVAIGRSDFQRENGGIIGDAMDALSVFGAGGTGRSDETTSEFQSLMRFSYAVFCSKKKKSDHTNQHLALIRKQESCSHITNKKHTCK